MDHESETRLLQLIDWQRKRNMKPVDIDAVFVRFVVVVVLTRRKSIARLRGSCCGTAAAAAAVAAATLAEEGGGVDILSETSFFSLSFPVIPPRRRR